jgi:DNA-binding beta-propeller fold protein YncE
MPYSLVFSKTRMSLILIALLAGLSACSQDKVEETQTVSEAEAPATTSAGFAYVTSQDAGVSVIDLATMEVVKQFDVKAEGPRGLGITDDGKKTDCSNSRK